MTRLIRFQAFAAFLLLSLNLASSQPPTFEPVLLSPAEGPQFTRLGLDGSGAVYLLDVDSGYYWRYLDDEWSLGPFDYEEASGYWMADMVDISRDAKYAVGNATLPDINKTSGFLWSLANPMHPLTLPLFEGDYTPKTTAVASTVEGPIVIGEVLGSAFLWSEGTGYTFWPATLERRYDFNAISADGQWLAGAYQSRTRFHAMAGNKERLSLLDDSDATNSAASAISPNGRHICGWATFAGQDHGMIWSNGGRPVILETGTTLNLVTDSGLASGRVGHQAIVFDPRGRKTASFEEWWERWYPGTLLPGPVRRVMDMYEHQDRLYCLIRIHREDFLAIVPFKTRDQQSISPHRWGQDKP